MTSVTGDERKDFIIVTAANYFGFTPLEDTYSALTNDKNLNNFLDDGSCFTLCAIPQGIGQELKITLDSKDDNWSYNFDPKLQGLITQLESGLRSVLQKGDPSSQQKSEHTGSLIEILSPEDEMQFWSNVANSDGRKDEKEKGTAFWYALEPLAKDFRSLDSLFIGDIDEILETAHNVLDDLWKLDDFTYPQHRMEHLMDIIGNTLTRFIQNKLKSLNIWEENYAVIEAQLTQAIHACEKWKITCERLTSLFWPNYTSHPWKGKPFIPSHIQNFCRRLEEVRT
ncbi:Cytoplasmic dynein 2 heavy chain 1 [Blattella germanica]|nr:Cytoplasmic dynein 2 heavy chain 1 [Blattella germanica]